MKLRKQVNSVKIFASSRICPFNKRKILEEATNIGRKGISEVSFKYNISKETIKGWKKRIKKGKELNKHGRPGPYRALSYGMKKLIQSKINFNIENYDIYEIESSHHATNFKNCEANQINTGVFSGIIEGWHGTPERSYADSIILENFSPATIGHRHPFLPYSGFYFAHEFEDAINLGSNRFVLHCLILPGKVIDTEKNKFTKSAEHTYNCIFNKKELIIKTPNQILPMHLLCLKHPQK